MKKRIVHRHLKLQHHRHTGRVLHHRHTSYRGLAIIIGLAGALIVGVNTAARAAAASMSTADTITVYASKLAPLPTVPSIITSTANNSIVRQGHLTISGTCEIAGPPSNIVILDDNNAVAGSTSCQSNGTFSLVIALEPGRHVLVAHTYTITDGLGPDGEPIIITYIPASSSTATGSNDGGSNDEGANGGNGRSNNGSKYITPLAVTADRSFVIFGPDKDAVWTGTITGGKQPYKVYIDWGDGNADTYNTITESGEQYFVHRYHTMRPYVIALEVTDAAGQEIDRQYAAATPYIPPAVTIAPTSPWSDSTLLGLYGAYLLVLVMFGALWARAHQTTYMFVPVPPRRRTAAKQGRQTRRSR